MDTEPKVASKTIETRILSICVTGLKFKRVPIDGNVYLSEKAVASPVGKTLQPRVTNRLLSGWHSKKHFYSDEEDVERAVVPERWPRQESEPAHRLVWHRHCALHPRDPTGTAWRTTVRTACSTWFSCRDAFTPKENDTFLCISLIAAI